MLTTLLELLLLQILWFIAHAEQRSLTDTNKGAIVTLAQGKSLDSRTPYRSLVKHNIALKKYVWVDSIDVIIFHEGMWNSNRSPPIRDPIGELVDGLRFMEASETQMVVGPIDCDVFLAMGLEGGHKGFEVFLASGFTQVGCGEV